ncbi:pyridoxamine 5'-phosphate oxidase family protein [uncultured Algibacter sp.]|uniref:pyridoxamine 5'-phosphate oxidase family protein n=1 Tax=uncultured Algibacter sp. TaxID=298659 RepID=UPI0030EE4932|tara:strand:+ start:5213 stop:5665 length:453 start_codon:yes stop_codon:yes gene_type:complete
MILKLGKSKCKTLLSNNYIGHLAYIYKNRPFVIPITYYYDDSTNALLGYSGNGHKIDALRLNNGVSVEVAEIDSVNTWKSLVVQGTFREFEGCSAKINLHKFSEGVKEIIKKKEGKSLKYLSEFSSKIFKEGPPIVFKIDIEELTGRERK